VIWRLLVTTLLLANVWTQAAQATVRLKDLVEFDGVRGNDLIGYGLVVGLNGTGDSLRNAPFTEDAMSNILERLGVNVTGEQFRPKNVAAVIVTASLRPFARAGGTLDVTVSAIGDSSSLLGGTLIMTPLSGADGKIYAVAQGSILAGGAVAQGAAAKEVRGVPTSGTIPGGARIEREIEFSLDTLQEIRLALKVPDFSTAFQIERAINQVYPGQAAQMTDSGTVVLRVSATGASSPAHALARIENLRITPTSPARVVVDQRSGTIVMGEEVRISRVAVAQGGLTLRVEEQPLVIQPNPFAEGETVVVPRTNAEIEDAPPIALAELPPGTSLSELVAGLNALGVAPRDMIDILNSINAAGALHAELIVR